MNTNSHTTKSKSLRYRIILTIGLLSLVRLGSFLPVPSLDREIFSSILKNDASSINAFAPVLKTFSGSKNNSFGLLSLGILPYINASIVVQLLTTALPSLAKMQKEEGEYGQRKLTDYVRTLTLFWAIVESLSLTYSLRSLIFDWSFATAAQISLSLTCGAMIVLWFSELITRHGLGNGSSLLICFNIVSSLPEEIQSFVFSLKDQTNTLESSLLLGFVFSITTLGCIYINDAMIQIPLVSARQLSRKNKTASKKFGNTNLPLRVNQAGVMPLVFTSYAMLLLSAFGSLVKSQAFQFLVALPPSLVIWGGKLAFWCLYASCIFFFTYFYSTIVLDPKDVAERLRKNSVVILGIAPGNATKTYLSQTLRRIASINALFLICNIVGLQVLEALFTLNILSLKGLGFTSQLILVNVMIDTLKRIRSFLNEETKIF